MLAEAAALLITTLANLVGGALLLRFLLQWQRVPAGHTLAPLLAVLTDFLVRPARRVIPGLWGLDLATLLLAWAVCTLEVWLLFAVQGLVYAAPIGLAFAGVAALGVMGLLRMTLYLFMIALVVQVILSWIAPYNDLTPVLNGLTRPLLRPLRRVIKPVGGIDFSPLVAIVVCQLLLIAVMGLTAPLIRIL